MGYELTRPHHFCVGRRVSGRTKICAFLFLIVGLTAAAPFRSLAQAPVAHASKEPLEALELIKEEESVSIAVRHEQPISQAPSNVYVITDEDIRNSGAIDLPTVLRRIPGIDVMQTTGADFNVSVRGDNQLQANKLLVLVDGRSIYFDMQGQVWWKSIPVTLPEIKRIEVLKGPASVLYGFNAFDGVINIITKSPDEMKGTTFQFGGGEYGTISSAAIQAGAYKNWGYRLSFGRDQTNQWNNRDALAFRDHKFNGLLEYKLKDSSKLSLTGGLVDTNRFDGQLNGFVHNASMIVNGYANVLYERPNMFIRAWWQGWDHNQTSNVDRRISRFISVVSRDGDPNVHTRQDSYNLEGQHAIELIPTNRLTYGFNYRHNTGSSNFISKFTDEDRLGLYIQDEWHPIQQLTFVGGVRMDMDTFINPTYSPRGAILYSPAENHTLRLSGSVAYRPPTMFETTSDSHSRVFFPGIPPFVPPSVIPGVLRGAGNLSPEKISSIELGYQGWFLRHTVRFRGDIFYNRISDLITTARVSTTPSVLTFVNSGGAADIIGLEAGLEYQVTSWLSGFLNYTYQHIGQTIIINDVRRGAPAHKVNAGLRGEWLNGLSGEAAFHYVSNATYPVSSTFSQFSAFPFNGPPAPNSTVDSYTLVNLRAAYRFWQQTAAAGYLREAEVAISAFNALNDKHKEYPLGDTIGSRVIGWLTIRY
jgi:iron complex outermembrane recepter protein